MTLEEVVENATLNPILFPVLFFFFKLILKEKE